MPTVKRASKTKPDPPGDLGWDLFAEEHLLEERQQLLDRQRRFMEITAAINASGDPDHVLRLIRDAIVDSGMFDRAGVWLYENEHFYGAWGTDGKGRLRDEHHIVEAYSDWGSAIHRVVRGEDPYYIMSWTPAAEDCPDPAQVYYNAVVGLRAEQVCVGVLSVDNLLSGRPVKQEDVEQLLPFADMAAAAIRTARMARERDSLVERQRRLMQLAAGMNASLELPEILHMVRDAVVEAAGFDRAAVFTVDSAQHAIHGAWGTDRNGNLQDGADWVLRRDDVTAHFRLWEIVEGKVPFVVTSDFTADYGLKEGAQMYGVRAHAMVPMKTGGEIVGLICVDNLLTDRPIGETEVMELLPFAEQAALAIRNARMFAELRNAQDALVRSEKLRALGELAGGVAHNINNLLTAVLGYAELIRQNPDNVENVRRYASIIESAGMDGAEIVRRVQQFAQQQTSSTFETVDLGSLVSEAIELARPYWRDQAHARSAGITLTLELGGAVPVSGAPSELREVVVNLLRNAVDAMPEGGDISVSCRPVGDEVVLDVGDSGVGMDEATRKRVFEPFFTTKGPALGLGLGLSVTWGIVVRHNGRITVDSRPGGGAKFRIALPLAQEVRKPVSAEPSEAPIRGMRILLVDDEPMVLDSLGRILEQAGALVRTAQSAEEGLAILDSGEAPDLVLTDHGMPGTTGLALLSSVRERNPSIRRALISGWGAAPPSDADLGPAEIVLSKPIARRALVTALSKLAQTEE